MNAKVEELECKVQELAADALGVPFWRVRVEVEERDWGYRAYLYRPFDGDVPSLVTAIHATPEEALEVLAQEFSE